MLSYSGLKGNRSQFLSLTGMEVEVFEGLHPAYQFQWYKYIKAFTVAGALRNRAHRERKDGVLEKTEDQSPPPAGLFEKQQFAGASRCCLRLEPTAVQPLAAPAAALTAPNAQSRKAATGAGQCEAQKSVAGTKRSIHRWYRA